MKKETKSKKLKNKDKAIKNGNENLIELKITHVLPKYENKSKDVEIYDGKHLTVWQNEDDINFWIGRTIAVLPLEVWEEVKKELRAMLFKDVKINYDYDSDEE
jgi:hypothetical protein